MAGAIRFYTDEQLGRTQSLTPEGFLLCEDVPIARTGSLLYAEGEIPVEGDANHIIRIQREDDEVFAPSAILSFAGKPVTSEHPPEKVAPQNWKDYSVGVVLNPRRGDARTQDARYLYADLLIQDVQAIQDVRSRRRRQVSAGYDAEYEQLRPGEGRQHNIIGNHVALVSQGRCGPTCSIGDSAMPATARQPTARGGPAWKDRIMRAYRTKDESALVDQLDKIGEMMGETWTGDDIVPGATPQDSDAHHHITVNIGHNPAGGAMSPETKSADVADPAPGVDPTAGASGGTQTAGNEGGDALSAILARLDALEEAVSVLANGDGDDGDNGPPAEDNDDSKTGDRRTVDGRRGRTRDDGTGKVEDMTGSGASEMTNPSMPGAPEDGKRPSERGGTGDRRTADRRASVGDSTSLRGAWQDFMARAEVLAPGYKVPTFDAAKPAKDTHSALCDQRRAVLGRALNNQDTAEAVTTMAGTDRPNFQHMTCDAVTVLFTGASEMVKRGNNARLTRDNGNRAAGGDALIRGTQAMRETISDINKRNQDFYQRNGRR